MSRPDSAANLKRPADQWNFKIYNRTVTPRFSFLRPNTQVSRVPMNFMLQQGGMGDYICWSIALQWLIKNAPWIDGRVWAPEYFIEFARHLFDDAPGWKVFLIDDFNKLAEMKSLIRGPSDQQPQLLNAVGASLVDLGFAYYANLCPAPAGIHYPEIKLDQRHVPKELRGKEKKYAVFTPGGTTHARLVRGRHINPLVRHAKERGLTPVFLGRHHLADVHASYFDEEIDFTDGIDLREKTTLFQAAAAMKYAAYTTGLDNGLLHLACCTDATVVFGYNIAHPSQRRPIRRQGKTFEIILTEKELACIHCQTNLKLICNHNFKNCFYEDQDRKEAEAKGEKYDSPKCIDILFENQGARWINAIERILREEKTAKDFEEIRQYFPERAA